MEISVIKSQSEKRGRRKEAVLTTADVLRLGISSALADYQPLRITRWRSDRCSAAEAAQKKSSKPRKARRCEHRFLSAGFSWGVGGGVCW